MASPVSNASRAQDEASSAQGQTSARAAAEIIALTTRDDFLLELGEALGGGQISVRPVDSTATALEQIVGARRLQLLVVDARETSDLRGDLDRIHAQVPNIVTVVFTGAEVEKSTAVALKGCNVFAVLAVPIDRRKTAAVFEGAVADAVSRRSSPRPSPDRNAGVSVESAQPERYVPPLDRDTGDGGDKRMIFAAAGAAALLLVAGGAWLLTRDDAPKAPATATAAKPAAPTDKQASVSVEAVGASAEANVSIEPLPVADTTVVQGTVDELLEKARFAMRDRRYTEPTGDNALLYYRSASAADPGNGEALDGLTRVASVLASRFDEAVGAARYDEAAQALVNFKSARPRDNRISSMETKLTTAQVSKALADGNVERAAALVRQAQQSASVPPEQIAKWRNEINRRQDEAKQKRLVDLALERVRDGRLVEPDNDNAKYYLAQLRELPGTNSAQQRVTRELSAAYLRKAREAGTANQKAEYDRWVAEARSSGASNADVTALQREITAARQRANNAEADRLGQLARDRLREGKLTEPAQDSAAFYLTSLQSADANNAALAPASRELAAKLLERAGTAAREGRSAQVEADLTLARRWGADPKDIQSVQAIPAARSASSSNLRQASSPPPGNLQNRLKRTRYVAPEFPERALAQKAAGAVVVEFVVDVNGEPRDVRIVSAEPAGLFDRAAIAAVRRWRYEPVVVDNVPTEVPARTSIRFALPNQ